MVGPVLYLEMLLGGRRGKQFVFRWVYAGWIVVQLFVLYLIYRMEVWTSTMTSPDQRHDPNLTGQFASNYVDIFVIQQLLLVLLATPAFTAGAITDEKTRGTLQHMLTAHLTAGEIIMGKLFGRMAQVAVLTLAGLPALCFIGVFGGMHPLLLLVVLASTLVPMFAIGAASLLASVWCRQTRDAVLSLYGIGGAVWLFLWIMQELAGYLRARVPAGSSPDVWTSLGLAFGSLLNYFNPLQVLEPAWTTGDIGEVARRLVGSIVAWGIVGSVCLIVATWRLRGAYLRQLENSGKRKSPAGEAVRRPAIEEEPIRWKERHIEGVAPLAGLRKVPRWVGVIFVAALTVLVSASWLLFCSEGPKKLGWTDVLGLIASVNHSMAADCAMAQAIAAMLIGSLIVGIRCSGAVSGEREGQTWEALLLTPMQTRELIHGKLWGIIGASVPYLVAYAVPAFILSVLGGFFAAFWTVLGIGVTTLAMYYVGAAGLWCSVRSKSSWRSLLGTLGFGYVGGVLLYAVTSPVTFIIAGIIFIFLKLADELYMSRFNQAGVVGFSFAQFYYAFFIASCVALVIAFWVASRLFLNYAEKRVSDRERIRHWKDEPLRTRRYRRPVPPHSRQLG